MSHLTEKKGDVTEGVIKGLRVLQPREGYRYSVDALLLADFASPRPRARVLELGAGCGIISMLLARRYPGIQVKALEIQKPLAELAKANVSSNKLEDRIEIIHGDINRISEMLPAGGFDYVVSNPPYRPPETGRLCKEAQEALARHEILTTLEGVLKAARYALKPGGKIALIYPADRTVKLLAGMNKLALEPKKMVFVHPARDKEARMVMTEGCKDAGPEVRVLPPMFLNE